MERLVSALERKRLPKRLLAQIAKTPEYADWLLAAKGYAKNATFDKAYSVADLLAIAKSGVEIDITGEVDIPCACNVD